MGGSDQWGNMTTGTELIRRKVGGDAYVLTCPLITKADGGKFGKTEKGNVWLDPQRTSPYQFYQFWLNASDADAEKWIRIFTFLKKEEVEKLLVDHAKDPGLRILQKRLAEEVTVFVHGREEYDKAIETTKKLFSDQTASVDSLSEQDLEEMEGVIKFDFPLQKIKNGIDVVSFLAESGSFSSKGDARKMVLNGGVSINREKVSDISMQISEAKLLHKKYILIQKGKKNYYLIKVNQ